MQFSPIIPPTRKIAREDAENSEMLHKWMGTNAIGAIVGDGVLDVPPAPTGRVAENRRFSVGRPGGRPLQVRIRRGAAVIVGVYCGTVNARSLHWVSLFVRRFMNRPPMPNGVGKNLASPIGGGGPRSGGGGVALIERSLPQSADADNRLRAVPSRL